MSVYSDVILFAVNLAFNLFIFGLVVSGGLIVSFRLIKTAAPRFRYLIIVAAFLIAAFLPLILTINGSILQAILSNTVIETPSCCFENSGEQGFGAAPRSISADSGPESEISLTESLNDFTLMISGSAGGVVFFILWISGVVRFLLRDAASYRKLRKAWKTWLPAIAAERKELLCPENIMLYFGEAESPGTVGIFYPVIVLPRHFPDDLSLLSKRSIVQHEAAHARWRDPLVNSLLRLVRSLLWVSPGLWFLERLAAGEREAAADYEAVIKSVAGQSEFEETVLTYAATLLSVARHFNSFSVNGSFEPHITGFGNESQLESRIRRLLTYHSKPIRLRLFLATTIFLASLIGLAFIPAASLAGQIGRQSAITAFIFQEPGHRSDIEFPSKMQFSDSQNQIAQAAGNDKKRNLQTNTRSSNEISSLNNQADGNSKDFLRASADEESRKNRMVRNPAQSSGEAQSPGRLQAAFNNGDGHPHPGIENVISARQISPVININQNRNIIINTPVNAGRR